MLKESPKVSLAKNPKFSSDKTPVGVDRIATQVVVEVNEERRKQYQGNESTNSLPRTQSATQKLGSSTGRDGQTISRASRVIARDSKTAKVLKVDR